MRAADWLTYIDSHVRLHGSWTTEPVLNLNGQWYRIRAPIYGRSLPLYRPVDWLIDNTRLDSPLFTWARLWGVESVFREAILRR